MLQSYEILKTVNRKFVKRISMIDLEIFRILDKIVSIFVAEFMRFTFTREFCSEKRFKIEHSRILSSDGLFSSLWLTQTWKFLEKMSSQTVNRHKFYIPSVWNRRRSGGEFIPNSVRNDLKISSRVFFKWK